jgi:hypothetical protein
MNIEEPVAETANTANSAEVPEKKKKFDVQAFLRRYRSLGLPNAKKMRKRTRIEALIAERNFYAEMVRDRYSLWLRCAQRLSLTPALAKSLPRIA